MHGSASGSTIRSTAPSIGGCTATTNESTSGGSAIANTKITNLTADTAPDAADVFPFVDVSAATTEKVTFANMMKAANMSIADSAALITGTTVETALAEIAAGGFAVNVVAATGATETLTLHPFHKTTMDQNCTFTFMTPTTAGFGFLLHLLGAFTPTFPGSVDWNAGAAPTYADDSLYQFVTDDTGTNWFGSLISSALA